jgi:VCBS repeat-containing protein
VTDTFTVTSVDGTATETVTVTVTGTNDAVVITGDPSILATANRSTGSGNLSASGNLTISDVDGLDELQATSLEGSYGTFSVTSSGAWTYSSSSSLNTFGFGSTTTDTFSVTAVDGSVDAVTVSIVGTDVTGISNSELDSVNYSTVSAFGVSGSYTIDGSLSAAKISAILSKTSTFNSSISVALGALDSSQQQAVLDGIASLTASSAGVGGTFTFDSFDGASSTQDLRGLWSSAFVTVNFSSDVTTLTPTQATYLADADVIGLAANQNLTINSLVLGDLQSLTGIAGNSGTESVTIMDNDGSGSSTTIDLKTKLSTIDDLEAVNIIGDTGVNVVQLSTALSTSGITSVYLAGGDSSTAADGSVDKLIFNLEGSNGFGTTGVAQFNQVYGVNFSAGVSGIAQDDYGIYYGSTNAATGFNLTPSSTPVVDLSGVSSSDALALDSVDTLQDLRSLIASSVKEVVTSSSLARFQSVNYAEDDLTGKYDTFVTAAQLSGSGTTDLIASDSNFSVVALAQFNTINNNPSTGLTIGEVTPSDLTSKPSGLI